jgi:hypothetical protein
MPAQLNLLVWSTISVLLDLASDKHDRHLIRINRLPFRRFAEER